VLLSEGHALGQTGLVPFLHWLNSLFTMRWGTLIVVILALHSLASGQPPQTAKCVPTGPYSTADWSLSGGYYFLWQSWPSTSYDNALAFCQNISSKANLPMPGNDA
jgi:hypothetical protein